jgi:hypothetical protein
MSSHELRKEHCPLSYRRQCGERRTPPGGAERYRYGYLTFPNNPVSAARESGTLFSVSRGFFHVVDYVYIDWAFAGFEL